MFRQWVIRKIGNSNLSRIYNIYAIEIGEACASPVGITCSFWACIRRP
nr:MAG TPA: hypothetical protein [Caudoviricetes sp.]